MNQCRQCSTLTDRLFNDNASTAGVIYSRHCK